MLEVCRIHGQHDVPQLIMSRQMSTTEDVIVLDFRTLLAMDIYNARKCSWKSYFTEWRQLYPSVVKCKLVVTQEQKPVLQTVHSRKFITTDKVSKRDVLGFKVMSMRFAQGDWMTRADWLVPDLNGGKTEMSSLPLLIGVINDSITRKC